MFFQYLQNLCFQLFFYILKINFFETMLLLKQVTYIIHQYSDEFMIAALTFIILACVDRFLKAYFSNDNLRWFILHVLFSLAVTIATTSDTISTFLNPKKNFTKSWSTNISVTIIYASHLYHVCSFKPSLNDIVHHIVMVAVGMSVLCFNAPFKGANFALCGYVGLPQVFIYLILALGLSEKISKEKQRKMIIWIYLWVRMPWNLFITAWTWEAIQSKALPKILIVNLICSLYAGIYLLEVTLKSNYSNLQKMIRFEKRKT